jgi:hypothetical protein
MGRMSARPCRLMLFALCTTALLFAFVPGVSLADDPDLVMEIITEKDMFAVGEDVNVTIRLTNIGAEPVLINYSSLPYVFYSVLDINGSQLYDVMLHINILLPVGTDTIAPGESKDIVYNEDPDSGLPFMIAWGQTNDGGTHVPAPGYYQITGYLDLYLSPVPVTVVPSWILIGDSSPPVAEFTYEPSNVHTDTIVLANASSSKNMVNGTEGMSYRWDWEGDGTWDTDWLTDSISDHQYMISGTYMMTLEVREPLGNTATAEAEVKVVGPDVPEFGGLVVPVLLIICTFSFVMARSRMK